MLYASVGGNQASVYTDADFQDHTKLICRYDNQGTNGDREVGLSACCWLSAEGWSQHPHGDACLVRCYWSLDDLSHASKAVTLCAQHRLSQTSCTHWGGVGLVGCLPACTASRMRILIPAVTRTKHCRRSGARCVIISRLSPVQAVGGEDKAIQIIGVAESRVVAVLRGHKAEVVALASASQKPGLLVSLSTDGDVRIWDIIEETCLHQYGAFLYDCCFGKAYATMPGMIVYVHCTWRAALCKQCRCKESQCLCLLATAETRAVRSVPSGPTACSWLAFESLSMLAAYRNPLCAPDAHF